MKKDEIIENCLEPREYWDDWHNYRDSFRSCNDRTILRSPFMQCANFFEVPKWNKKIKLSIQRRKAKKEKQNNLRIMLYYG